MNTIESKNEALRMVKEILENMFSKYVDTGYLSSLDQDNVIDIINQALF